MTEYWILVDKAKIGDFQAEDLTYTELQEIRKVFARTIGHHNNHGILVVRAKDYPLKDLRCVNGA